MKKISQPSSSRNTEKLDKIDQLILDWSFIEASDKAIKLTSDLKKSINRQKDYLDKLLQ
jgi:hypothetical protein